MRWGSPVPSARLPALDGRTAPVTGGRAVIRSAHRMALASILAMAALPATAESKLEPPDLERYLRWGPLRVRPGIELTNLGYDDNILANDRQKVDDYTATWSPKVEGLVLFGSRAFVTFQEKLEFTAYLDNDDQNFHNQKGSARLTVPLRKVGFFSDVALNRTKQRPPDLQSIRPEQDEDGLAFGVIFRPGWRTEIEIGHGTTDFNHSDEVARVLDRDERRDSLEVDHHLLGRTWLTLTALRETTDFDDVTQDGKDTEAWSVLPGVKFAEGGSLTGSARVGWAELETDDRSFPDFDDVVGDLELAYRLNRRTTFKLEGRRAPEFSVFEERVFFLYTRYTARVTYFMNRSIGFVAGGRTGKLDFPGVPGERDREDRINAYDVGLRLRLAESSVGRRVEYSIKVGRYRRDSSLPDGQQDISRTTFSFGAIVGY